MSLDDTIGKTIDGVRDVFAGKKTGGPLDFVADLFADTAPAKTEEKPSDERDTLPAEPAAEAAEGPSNVVALRPNGEDK
jgi:hypothetical protein